LKLKKALALASESYAEARVSRAELSASDETLRLAKKTYYPSVDLYVQWNRATRNNVFGLLFPSGGVPSISGPVLEEESSEGTFGSLAAALVRWEAFDFGTRGARVREAEALRRGAEAGVRLTELEVSLGTMDSYLGVAAGHSAVQAAAAAVARMEVFTESISALVGSELRPGADLSLARAELARARNELIRSEEQREQARVCLAEWLGRAGERVEIEPAELLESRPAAEAGPPLKAGAHPLAELGEAERDAARARRESVSTVYRPKVDLLGTIYGRGTGALVDGSFEGGSAGLWPERTNWAVGLAVRFPLLEFAARQETKVREYLEQAAEARYEFAVERVETELGQARIHLDAARRIAENTPAELDAARALSVQARARYDAGLADILEVAEAERILRRAETEDAVARLDVWRARFELAAAEGDLAPVLTELE
jgi:outer membrane protein TolC